MKQQLFLSTKTLHSMYYYDGHQIVSSHLIWVGFLKIYEKNFISTQKYNILTTFTSQTFVYLQIAQNKSLFFLLYSYLTERKKWYIKLPTYLWNIKDIPL